MNIADLKAVMDAALRDEWLEDQRLFPRGPKVWSLPASDIIRFFSPQPYRRPWGFVYSGGIGVEIPALRGWLRDNKSGQVGIFHFCFVSYLTINEEVFRDFMVAQGEAIPANEWAGLVKDRLARIPSSLDQLLEVYRANKEELGWLARPHHQPAWDFLLRWRDNPEPTLHVPTMQPDGRIV